MKLTKRLCALLLCVMTLVSPLAIKANAADPLTWAGIPTFLLNALKTLAADVALDVALNSAGKALSAAPDAKRYNKLIHTVEGRAEYWGWEIARKNMSDTSHEVDVDWQRAEAQSGKMIVSGWLGFNDAYEKFYGSNNLHNAPKSKVNAAKNYADLYNMVLLADRDIKLMDNYWASYDKAYKEWKAAYDAFNAGRFPLPAPYQNVVPPGQDGQIMPESPPYPSAPNLSPGWTRPQGGATFGAAYAKYSASDRKLSGKVKTAKETLAAQLAAAKTAAEALK
jgi:hypothetical protein